MTTPLGGKHFSDMTRQYVARIGSIYNRARALLVHDARHHGSLESWNWYRASAQGCIEEAVIIYTEGLETLIRLPVMIEYQQGQKGSSVPQFSCRLLDEKAADERGFRVRRKVMRETQNEREAVEALLGGTEREVLNAFAEGLCNLRRLGAFKHRRKLRLDPEHVAAGGSVLSAPAEETPRRL